MISDSEAERAVDYLRDTSEKAGIARANVAYLEGWLKVIKAEEMARHAELGVSAQEREALCAKRYHEALKGYQEAVREDSTFRFMREAAMAKLECWRTECSNNRAATK
jgi:hypothetical protein